MNGIKNGFTLWKKGGVRYFTIPSFEQAGGLRCAFSTRIGGVSPPPFDTLNFSRKREQSEENYQENMPALRRCGRLRISKRRLHSLGAQRADVQG